MPPRRPSGLLLPFLSARGGEGCTGLLASVALLLARAGRRVLCVDLRADGGGALSRRLAPLQPLAEGAPGLDLRPGAARAGRRAVPLPAASAGVLHLLGPGAGAPPQPPAALSAAVLAATPGLLAEYDVVLLDLGPEPAGPSLAAAADRVVLCLRPGALALERAVALQATLGEAGPPIVPVVGPLPEGPAALRAEVEARLVAQLGPLLRWAGPKAAPSALLSALAQPYSPALAWAEGLPLAQGSVDAAGSPAGAAAALAALLAAGPGLAEALRADRAGALAAALGPIEPHVEDIAFDVFLSAPNRPGAVALRRRLGALLGASGLQVGSAEPSAAPRGAAGLAELRGRARAFVVLVGAQEGAPPDEELFALLRVAEERAAPLVPVFVGPGAFARAPGPLRGLHGFFLEDGFEDLEPLAQYLLRNLRARA
ncbi:MAG: hypothetical protein JNM72_25190 [Deltaproteobacteria bacterium]|jgi:hypothetical protein|nr:hypothetical protein [Deltaproteobacteria bacterium]